MLKLAKEMVEDVEAEMFYPALADAGEDTSLVGQALEVGKAKNDVLFATAAVQALKIEAAQNKAMKLIDPYGDSKANGAEAYLNWTIQADRSNAGKKSCGVLRICNVGLDI
ncbi:hypothetical protein DFH11DRAFT_1067646 [Phellopilus nigrolimitatus]|nr:hypothetical protein DFH11DRAFT_1067646 [Phellopilus nigrolimitatus]